ncbi:hypothetical protein Golomagni_07852 [Golovinomyces magnicellulatus]|nr:hypothetical protein Golomagni_07852 [Golovinomyces magnicellulatus]
MDDIVGLVMVQIISNLGASDANISAVTVVRPLLVSVAFAVCAPIICKLVVAPVTLRLNQIRVASPAGKLDRILTQHHTAWVIHTLILIALITGSTYAGTSNLFASYIAGACISWWDTEVSHPGPKDSNVVSQQLEPRSTSTAEPESTSEPEPPRSTAPSSAGNRWTGSSSLSSSYVHRFRRPLSEADILGIHWFLHSHYGIVQWPNCVERHSVHSADDCWQARMRILATTPSNDTTIEDQ